MMNKKLFALLVAIATVNASTFAFLSDLVEDTVTAPGALVSSDARQARRDRIEQRDENRRLDRQQKRQNKAAGKHQQPKEEDQLYYASDYME